MKKRLAMPFRGAVNATTRQDHPIGTAPLERLRNFSVYSGAGDTAQGGKRPPLELIYAQPLANAPVQALMPMARSSFTSGFELGECDELGDGYSVLAAGLEGNFFALSGVPNLSRMYSVDVTGEGGTQSLASVVAVSVRGNRIVVASNFDTSGNAKAIVECWNFQGERLWTQTIEESGIDRYVNTVSISPDGNTVAVTTNQWVQLHLMVDGSLSGARDNVDGWSNECTDARWRSDGKLLVAFLGSGVGGITYGGTTINSAHFRSGVALYSIVQNFLSRETFGPMLLATDPVQEAGSLGGTPVRHGYVRFAEFSALKPRGCYPTCLAVGPDDSFVVGRTNQGWGPDWSPPSAGGTFPDGSKGYVSVAKYAANGSRLWEANWNSNLDAYSPGGFGATFYNDIDNPTILTAAVGLDGAVYVGGRLGGDGKSVWKLEPLQGVLKQAFDAGATVRGLLVDPLDGNLWVAMDRNPDWTGSSGAYAHLLRLRPADMTVLDAWDLGENVSGLCVARADRDLVYGTDNVA